MPQPGHAQEVSANPTKKEINPTKKQQLKAYRPPVYQQYRGLYRKRYGWVKR
jgi:hypothetical protein